MGELGAHETLTYAIRISSTIDDGSGLFFAVFAVFVAAVSTSLARVELSPRWLARLGRGAAVVRAVGVLDVTTLGAWPFGPFMVAGTVLCVTWLFLTSLMLVRSAAVPARPDLSRGLLA